MSLPSRRRWPGSSRRHRRAPGSRRAATRSRRGRRCARGPPPPAAPKVGIEVCELPQATSSRSGPAWRIARAASAARSTVLRGSLVPGLPRTVELVAETPQPNPVRIASTVGDALVRQRRARRVVDVLQQVERLGDPAGSEVDGEHRFDTGPAAHFMNSSTPIPVGLDRPARRDRGAPDGDHAARCRPPSGSRR